MAVHESQYRKAGFRDASVSFDNRLQKSQEYLQRALPLFSDAADKVRLGGAYDQLTNVYFRQATAQEQLGRRDEACKSLKQASEAAVMQRERAPSGKTVVADGHRSIFETIDKYRSRIGCE